MDTSSLHLDIPIVSSGGISKKNKNGMANSVE